MLMRQFPKKFTGTIFIILLISMVWSLNGYSAENEKRSKAIFAGGCFWCMEEVYEKVTGVIAVTSGYTGGRVVKPTYEQVSAGETGHAESVEVIYDPTQVSYDHLLEVFWRNVDPTVKDAQFCDHGSQYRSAIFYLDGAQKRLAETSKDNIQAIKSFGGPLYTEITQAEVFYPAEDYHQDFYKKNPTRYKFYKWSCGRAQRLEQLWGKS
ncbi:MAG: peptide-methionine (S)-S-oxide reductase MsrA [Nitrospirales bacterium]|nr:peptide-methionine (S)-S-oxide reductase MsrA [Nitrospirales bacterium]